MLLMQHNYAGTLPQSETDTTYVNVTSTLPQLKSSTTISHDQLAAKMQDKALFGPYNESDNQKANKFLPTSSKPKYMQCMPCT